MSAEFKIDLKERRPGFEKAKLAAFDKEPLPPRQRQRGQALATAYAEVVKRTGAVLLVKMPGAPLFEATGVHDTIVKGLPAESVARLLERLPDLALNDIARAIGVSARTLSRYRKQTSGTLSAEVGSSTWRLAETTTRAERLFGGREQAQRWLADAAMGLDGQRPIDLMQTSQGAQLVDAFLTRLEHGVYN